MRNEAQSTQTRNQDTPGTTNRANRGGIDESIENLSTIVNLV